MPGDVGLRIRTKVAFVGGTRYPQPLDRTSKKKFRTLEALGELFVIGFSQDWRPRCFAQHARFYLFPKLPWPILRYAEMLTLGPFLALWIILRHGARILVAQSPHEGFAAALAKQAARFLACRVVLIVESHGDFEESLFLRRRVLFAGLYRQLMRWTARFSLRHADLLRAVSHSTRRQLQAWTPEKTVFQFPAWTDLEVFSEAGNGRRDPRARDILYAGVLIPLKGVHFLLEAFASIAREVPDARLWIVGRAENAAYARELKVQARQLGIDGRVSFVDEVSQRELAGYVSRCTVFALPSLSEGLPRVVFESMACGTPVIASDVSGIPEVVEDGATGFLVSPGDRGALTERLLWVLTHPEEARAMGERARLFAQGFFSTEAYTQNYANLFSEAERLLQ